jgi:phosphoglycerol transferase MdoB-like AlkP superfamily enzyme
MKNRFGLMYLGFLIFISISTVIRTALLFLALPHLDLGPWLLCKVYGTGFFFDTITFFYWAIPFAFYLVLVPDRVFSHAWHKPIVHAVFFVIIAALLFDAAAEYLFFDEFGVRFNFIAVDYLVYTREVLGNIWESYPLVPIFSAIALASAALYILIKKYIVLAFTATSTWKRRVLIGAVFVVAPMLSIAFVDLPMTSISKNTYANELAGNGLYDLVAAFRNNELDYNRFYATRDERTVQAAVRRQLRERNNVFASADPRDMARIITNTGPEKRMNVIVVVEESLSAEYLGVFGRSGGYTPNFDRLAGESLFFTHLYATGTRTVRGLEAITLSIPPLPGISIVKRPGNEGFFSWGSLMRKKGYDTKFVYAGHGYFDNMNYFFSNNGFSIVDRSNFGKDEITFANIWGVCDEDLFRKVVREADSSHAAGKPFFTMVMTTSNHRPYTYPEGKIDIPAHTGRGGGVKYADYAVGQFIEQARKKPWFDNTLFVFVADHCAASAGKTELPIKKYEIPLIIYGPAQLKPQRVDTMMSQIDIAPTVLGLLNFSYTTKFMGRDILKTGPSRACAFISTYQKLGFIQGDTLVVLGPQQYLKTYRIDRKTGAAVETAPREETIDTAIAYFQGANYFYSHRSDRIAPSTSKQ